MTWGVDALCGVAFDADGERTTGRLEPPGTADGGRETDDLDSTRDTRSVSHSVNRASDDHRTMTGAGDADDADANEGSRESVRPEGRPGDSERASADERPGRESEFAESDPPDDEFDHVPLGEPQGLDPAVRYYWLIGALVGAVPLTVFVTLLAVGVNELLTPIPVGNVAAATFGLGSVLGGVRSLLRYRSWEYVVREESLYLRRGVLTHVRTVVPYVRVQHIDTRRGALERLFGLSSLVVYTAGSRGADVTVPGLTPERASALQARLKRLAIESEEEDAV